MIDTDNADQVALFANTPAQIDYLLHNLEKAARVISLLVNSDKTQSCILNKKEPSPC